MVDDVRELTSQLFDLPPVDDAIVFDQSVFVKQALNTVLHEGVIGLVLTSLMILVFLGSMRATGAVLLSIPISALATFVVLYMMGSTVNTMILGGLALAFSRVIDNSVISLENIYRHLEMGSSPAVAAEQGGAEVNLAVLAATLVDVVDFFPVTLLYRREQISIFSVGVGVLPLAARVVHGRDDRDPAVLREISASGSGHGTVKQRSAKRIWTTSRRASRSARNSMPGSIAASTTCSISMKRWCAGASRLRL